MRSQSPTRCFSRRRAFTLIELLVVLCLLSLLLSLIVPALGRARQAAIELGCVANIRSLGQVVGLYTLDFKESFPSDVSDRTEILEDPVQQNRYVTMHHWIFYRRMWRETTGVGLESSIFRCPACRPSRITNYRPHSNYSLSMSLYMKPESLREGAWPLPEPMAAARVQRQSDVLFPSAKSLLYEDDIWHAFDGAATPGQEVGKLEVSNSRGPGSVAFADGHAGLVFAQDALAWVRTPRPWFSCPFGTTLDGVRGRDR